MGMANEKLKALHNTPIPRPSGLDEESKSAKAIREARNRRDNLYSNPDSSEYQTYQNRKYDPNERLSSYDLNDLRRASELFGINLMHLTRDKEDKILRGKRYEENDPEFSGVSYQKTRYSGMPEKELWEIYTKAKEQYGWSSPKLQEITDELHNRSLLRRHSQPKQALNEITTADYDDELDR